MRHLIIAALLTVCAGELAPATAQSAVTFHSSIEVVPISAVVRDNRGRLVTNLSAVDFEVFDKGERRPIVDFQIDRASAISMAILLDVSGSMRIGPKLALAGDVVDSLTAALRDGRDEVALFTFDSALHEQQPFTAHPAALAGAIGGTHPFGTTSLYDAIAETARRLQRRPSPRRAIVVLTDGIDTSSVMSASQVSGLASAIDVPVYVVSTVPPIDRDQSDRATTVTAQASADLRDLAFWTGGDQMWVTEPGEASMRIADILSELRQEYLIAIESTGEREWRPIDIRVRDRRLTVRARSGYFGREQLK